jgi:toxin ParE1/3/4
LGEVSFTDEAREDLLAIEAFLAERSPQLADRFIDSVLERCRQLERFPELGPVRPDINHEARCLTYQRWLILYRLVQGGVGVVRILDGARDPGALFWPEDRA